MKVAYRILLFAFFILAALSCSTTRVLEDGQYRLAKNKIKIENSKTFNPSILDPYLKQRPNSYFIFGWNPFLNIYNWSTGKGNVWDKFVQKIGVDPVVYETDMVYNSIENLKNHLDYRGYYH